MTVTIFDGDCREVLRTPRGRFIKGVHAYRQPRPHWRREWLFREYVERERAAADIADEIDCTENNVLFWLKKHGISRRSMATIRAAKYWGAAGSANPMHGRTGPLNPGYVDGSSPERQMMYVRSEGRAFLAGIYRRDGFKCVRCTAPKRGARSLHAHHIKPWAGNDALRFDEKNVVTLCRPCHEWVHSKRNIEREYLA